jgi:5-hydroxyisourate hydrolase
MVAIMSAITTHILDAVLGKPAADVTIYIEKSMPDGWIALGESATDNDGRCRDLCTDASEGTYRLTFAVGNYFKRQSRTSIYPEISITFLVDGEHHYHIPLLLSDNSYTTYRGS